MVDRACRLRPELLPGSGLVALMPAPAPPAGAADPANISGTVGKPDGAPAAAGSVTITWPAFGVAVCAAEFVP